MTLAAAPQRSADQPEPADNCREERADSQSEVARECPEQGQEPEVAIAIGKGKDTNILRKKFIM